MDAPDVAATILLARRTGLRSLAVAAACSLAFGTSGCRTTEIGAPAAIRIPQNLTEAEAQRLVGDLIDGKLPQSRSSGRVTRRRLGRWRIEGWEPGSMVASYSWQAHILRIHIAFADRTTSLEIGDSENLHQSAKRIHKRAKALAMELGQDIRHSYARAGMAQQTPRPVARQSTEATKPSLCLSQWGDDPHERARCQRAQRRAYDRLRPLIAQVEARPTTVESKRLRACYARTKAGASPDWEALEQCFYSLPASAR